MTDEDEMLPRAEVIGDFVPSGLRKKILGTNHSGHRGGLDILKWIGPGLLVTVGFIDPGNWASNMAAGSTFGYGLLWVVTLSTIMLIVLQHNVAHLGIVTGECLAESCSHHLRPLASRLVLGSALLATVATMMAEVLGGAIALNMLFGIPEKLGSVITAAVALALLLTNSYGKVERIIIGFVSLIGLAFLVEIAMVRVDWPAAAVGWVAPSMPAGSSAIIVSVLGAVVMPHNLFLHSEVIQSQHYEGQGEGVIRERLDHEFVDTLFSMIVGWAINSAMVILAASTFFSQGIVIDDLSLAAATLEPMLGQAARVIFALALLFAGLSSSVTAGMAAGTISSGIAKEPYDIHDRHSSLGVIGTFVLAVVVIFFVTDPFQGLVWSQALLSLQLPITIFTQIRLTSSSEVMGAYANGPWLKALLVGIGVVVTVLNVILLTGV
ncbi:Nramp family divalent metal transporter [uncultured Parolsenella sp.]|uniref:Nramp family divalent metal transporter n=1 Tax=uncultured Parolsenella sp. TaxID=2083008 RepID=UPI0027D96A3E|nr:Nramp family divalent metal transporter [uncultured Parolsenella sp.]